jgi:hypothetical protein
MPHRADQIRADPNDDHLLPRTCRSARFGVVERG